MTGTHAKDLHCSPEIVKQIIMSLDSCYGALHAHAQPVTSKIFLDYCFRIVSIMVSRLFEDNLLDERQFVETGSTTTPFADSLFAVWHFGRQPYSTTGLFVDSPLRRVVFSSPGLLDNHSNHASEAPHTYKNFDLDEVMFPVHTHRCKT